VSTELHFDLLQFRPLSWKGFLRRYVGAIQPTVVWQKIINPKVGLHLLGPEELLALPWYKDGDWRDGQPRLIKPGSVLAVVRIPAVLWKGTFVALDGCHRLSEVRPAMVLIDYFVPRERERVYITDLFNRYMGRGKSGRNRNR